MLITGCKPTDPSVPSPPTAKIPLRGPLYGWKNRGEAPRRWLLSKLRLGGFGPRGGAAQAQAGSPTASLPRTTCPAFEISGQVPRVPGLVSRETEALPATQRTTRFLVDYTSQ